MFGKLLNELRDIGTRFHIVGNPGETSASIVLAERLNDLGKAFVVERPKDTVRAIERNAAFAKSRELLERCKRVTHTTFSLMRNELERFRFELHPFLDAHRTKTRSDLIHAQTMEVETLTARMDGIGHLLRVGSTKDEHHMARRFFERLQKRIERCR